MSAKAQADAAADAASLTRLQLLVEFLVSERIYNHELAILGEMFAAPLMARFQRDRQASKRTSVLSSIFGGGGDKSNDGDGDATVQTPSILAHTPVQLWCHALEQICALNKGACVV